jgi:HEAT repeat protein
MPSRRPRRLILIAALTVVAVSLTMVLWRVMIGSRSSRGADPDLVADSAAMREARTDEERIAVVRGFVVERKPAALPLLASWARQEGGLEFRLACVRALGEMGDARAAHDLGTLARTLQIRPEVRTAAVTALGTMPEERALPHLAFILTNEKQDDALRLAAMQSIARYDSGEATALLGQATADDAIEVGTAAVAALAQRKTAEATDQLVAAMRSLDPRIRAVAVAELGQRREAPAQAAVAQAASDPDETVRLEALKSIRMADAAAAEKMLNATDKRAGVPARLEVAKAIHRAPNVKLAAALLHLLDDLPRAEVQAVQELRREVRDGLLAMGGEALAPVLAAALEGECDAPAEQVAVEVCRALGRPAVEPIVAGILRWELFPDPEELKMWIEVLGDLGEPAALPAFNRALAQDIAGMADVVAAARARIEKRNGAPLPPCAPDAGILSEPPDLARAVLLAAPPAFHLPEHADSAGVPENGVVRFVLSQAMERPAREALTASSWRDPLPEGAGGVREAPSPDRLFDLEIEMPRRNGAWQPHFIAYAHNYNKMNHHGRLVSESRGPGGEVRLKIELFAQQDQWILGGYGEYELTFPNGQMQFAGSYRGHFNHDARQGTLAGACWQMNWLETGYPRFAAGEHPRLLFREFHLDALRERARTEFGREVLRVLRQKLAAQKRLFQERVDWVTTWAPGMHLATGHGLLAHLFGDAEHGRRAAALVMERTTTIPYGGEHGERYPPAWLTSPYGYDMAHAFLSPEQLMTANTFYGRFCKGFIFSCPIGCMGNLNARGAYQVPGLTALSLVGEPGPFDYARPWKPAGATVFAGEAPPARESGAPVNDPRPNALIAEWLILGPVPVPQGGAPLEALGPIEKLRARPGLAVETAQGRREFQPLPPEWVQETGGSPKARTIRIVTAQPGAAHYLYCELQNERRLEGLLDWKAFLALGSSRVWLDGREMSNRALLLLEPGRHRMVAEVQGAGFSPYLFSANARVALALQKLHDWQYALREEAEKRHETTGQMTQMEWSLDMCRHTFRDVLRRQAEEIRVSGSYVRGTLMLASAVRMATGEQLYVDTPSAVTAAPRACLPYLSPEELCFAMGLAPPNLQPALVAEFNRRFLPGKLHDLDCILLVAALVNYPLHIQPSPLPGVDDKMLANREAFNVSFLAGGESDLQVQAALRDEKPRLVGPEVFVPRAGALSLRGYGGQWVTCGPAPDRGRYEAVVEIEGATDDGPCRVLDFQSDPRGTGFASLDMSPVYARKDAAAVSAQRQVAVDYSGRSGAELLLVVRDRIRGPGRKTWTLPVGVGFVDLGDKTYCARRLSTPRAHEWLYVIQSQPRADAQGKPQNEFVLRSAHGAAAARGAILSPAACEVSLVATTTKGTLPVIRAAATEQDVEFLVVLTMQKGTPPPVSCETQGAETVIQVGPQKVRVTAGGMSLAK